MDCTEVTYKHEGYFTGNIAGQVKAEIDQHLDGCDDCRLFYKINHDILFLLEEEKKINFNKELSALILQKIAREKSFGKHGMLKLGNLLVAASIAIFLLAGILLGYMAGSKYTKGHSGPSVSETTIYNEMFADDLGIDTFNSLLNNE